MKKINNKFLAKKAILLFIIAALTINIASAEKYFVLDVNHFSDSVTFNSIALKEVENPIKNTEKSGFLIRMVSFDGTAIGTSYKNMSENREYLIYAPYSQNAARIEMYDMKNSKIMDVDVSSFADTCGNKICEPYESYENCPTDCPSGAKDGFCDGLKDGICDPDCTPNTDPDCNEGTLAQSTGNSNIPANPQKTKVQEPQTPTAETPAKSNFMLWALMALVFIAAASAAAFLLMKKRKEEITINSLKQYISENIRRGFTLQQIKDTLFRAGYKPNEIEKAIRSI